VNNNNARQSIATQGNQQATITQGEQQIVTTKTNNE
jgi:hypothetical protein